MSDLDSSLESSHAARVVLVVESPLSERDARRFGIEELRSAGLTVEAWEVAPVFLPRSELQWVTRPSDVVVRRLTSVRSIEHEAAQLRSADTVICIAGVYTRQYLSHRRLMAALSKSKARVTSVVIASRPEARPHRGVDNASSLGGYARRLKVAAARSRDRTLGWMYREQVTAAGLRLLSKLVLGIKPLDAVWVGTTAEVIHPLLRSSRTSTTFIHTLDYDAVLTLPPSLGANPDKIVLIDSMGPLHPDATTLGGGDLGETPEEHFAVLRRVLVEVEQQSGSRVQIAAHPRAQPGSLEGWFDGFEVLYGATVNAIAGSRAVLLANATTIASMIVAIGKPAVMIRSQSFPDIVQTDSEFLARLLNLECLDADEPNVQWREPTVDERAYRDYFRKYVKREGTVSRPFWSVVADDIQSANATAARVSPLT
jgi:hypothetical protein